MLKWKLSKNLVSELYNNNGANFIHPWGLETADSWSFFSLEKGVGYRYSLLGESIEKQEKVLTQHLDIQFKEGRFSLVHKDQLDDKVIIRESDLIARSDSVFMDFVQRYRFKKEFFEYALIAGQKIVHTNSNVYHQFPVKEVVLKGTDLTIRISIDKVETANKFTPTMYVRDRGDEWIVHVRMIPSNDEFMVIKLCSRYFKTSPLPQWLTSAILFFPTIRNALRYRTERSPYKSRLMNFFAPNAFPMVRLKCGERLSWKSKLEVL